MSAAYVAVLVSSYYVLPRSADGVGSVAIRIALSVALLVIAVGVAVPYVLRSEAPILRAFEALAFVVGLSIVSFASAYLLMSAGSPSSFSEPLGHTDALYFSMTTSTTIGYGDISAKSEAARIVVMVHMVTNVVVLGVAAKLITGAARRRIGSP